MIHLFLPVTAQAATPAAPAATSAALPATTTPGAAAQPGAFDGIMSMLPLLVIFFVVMYFLIIRPQKKEQKRRQEMLEAIKVGDRVVTTGGIFGTIAKVMETSYILELAEGVRVEVVKFSVAEVVTPKTEK